MDRLLGALVTTARQASALGACITPSASDSPPPRRGGRRRGREEGKVGKGRGGWRLNGRRNTSWRKERRGNAAPKGRRERWAEMEREINASAGEEKRTEGGNGNEQKVI